MERPGIPLSLIELYALTLIEQVRRTERSGGKERFDLCFIPHLLTEENRELLAENLKSDKKNKRFQIIIGTNDDRVSSDESHWSALDIDLERRTIIAFDARLGGPRDELKSLSKEQDDILGPSGKLFWKKAGFRLYSVDIGRQVQYDSFSCHVFAYNMLKNTSQVPDFHELAEVRWASYAESGQQSADGALRLLPFDLLPFDVVKAAQNMKFFTGKGSKDDDDTSGPFIGSYFDYHQQHFGLETETVRLYQEKLEKYRNGRFNERIQERSRRYEGIVAAFFELVTKQEISFEHVTDLLASYFKAQIRDLKRTGRLSIKDMQGLLGAKISVMQIDEILHRHKKGL